MTAPAANTGAETALPIPAFAAGQPSWLRLEDQLQWYDAKSSRSQSRYKRTKLVQVTLAVAIPVMTLLPADLAKACTAVAGATIALLEALQQMNQDATLWVSYRSTHENLKHEKFLFLAGAGRYRGLADADRMLLLAERVEEVLSAQHAKWAEDSLHRAEPEKAMHQ